MIEERSCKTCRFHFGNSKLGVICDKFIRACNSFDKWQPIQKAPFQMTEEEARVISKIVVCDSETCKYVDNDCVECRYYKLKHAGYIRESELVELVEEAEKIWAIYYSDPEFIPTNMNCKLYQALQALKKDHPEFGGKK